MLVIVGSIVVLASVLIGFSMAGGHVGALIHPSEFVTIGGASLGGLIICAPKRVIMDLMKALIALLKGAPFSKQAYLDVFLLFYMLCRVMRRDGLLALDGHVSDPKSSDIFQKFPRIMANHHLLHFIMSCLSLLFEGKDNVAYLQSQMDAEIHVIEQEHHDAVGALAKTADALPGFGIVAAVLGIVVTMQAINGPAEEIGHKVGAALVGTFLGILMSYGFFAPMAGRMELLGAEEISFFRMISGMTIGLLEGTSPKDLVTRACRGVGTEFRPSKKEIDTIYAEGDKV